MRNPLDRLLRLRSLQESVSRVELEMQLRELSRIEGKIEALEQIRKASRSRSFTGFAHQENQDWLEAEALGDLAGWEREKLIAAREKKALEVHIAKAEYLERRKELMQVETIVDARMLEHETEKARREQRILDDWFGQRNRRTSFS